MRYTLQQPPSHHNSKLIRAKARRYAQRSSSTPESNPKRAPHDVIGKLLDGVTNIFSKRRKK